MSGRLDEIRARWAEVTPWPWSQDGNNAKKLRGVDGDTFAWVLPDGDTSGTWTEQNQRDMDALANAPADVAWLVDELEEARGALDALALDHARMKQEVQRLQEEQRNARNAVSFLALGHLSVPDAIRELNAGGLRAMDRADAAEHEMREALLDRDVARRTAKRCIDWAVAHGFSLPFGGDHVLADDTSTDDELLDLAKRLEWSRDAAMARAAEDREAMKTLEAELATFRNANERAHQTLFTVMAERDAALAVLAEPTDVEMGRLANVAYNTWFDGNDGRRWPSVVRAILADLRARAGVTRG